MDTVVEAMKLGAYDYISKPFNLEKIKSLIKGALEAKRLAKELAPPKKRGERINWKILWARIQRCLRSIKE